jgi:hypothetical protein
MNINFLVGVAALGYGLYTLYARATRPVNLAKLEAMKAQWGDRNGTIVHVVAYTVAPILVGVVLIVSSL